jgi:hypothetical protein
MLVGDIGLVYTGYHIAKGEAVNFEDMWYAITTFIGRVAAILFFTSLFFVLCFCCTIIFVYNKTSSGQVFTHPLWTLLLVILMFLGPLLSFAYMGVILYNLNIKASIEKGIHLFLDNIGILLGLFLLVLTISVIVNLVATLITLLIQSNFDIDRLGDISFGTYGTLAPTLLFGIIRTIGTFLVTPFTTMLYVLVYMHSRYGRPVSQSDGSNME